MFRPVPAPTALTAPISSDGKLVVAPDPETSAGGFKTRLVVYRPTDPAKFNGTVYVEWLNVSAGFDAPADWIMAHNDLIRSGAAWVGVSAQQKGVDTLVANDAGAVRLAPSPGRQLLVQHLQPGRRADPGQRWCGGARRPHASAADRGW